ITGQDHNWNVNLCVVLTELFETGVQTRFVVEYAFNCLRPSHEDATRLKYSSGTACGENARLKVALKICLPRIALPRIRFMSPRTGGLTSACSRRLSPES